MAASMFRKGLLRLQTVCAVHHEFEVLHRAQKPHCRYMQSAASKKSKKKPVKKKYLGAEPKHSIYIMEDYPPQTFTLEQCLNMHKEAAQPAMTNTLHAPIYADIKLDFTTSKKTKFLKNIRGILTFPQKFEYDQKLNIYCFSENPEDWKLCKELGANQVGGDDLISYINQGIIRKDDIDACDFIFSTPVMAVKLLKLRSALVDKTPTLKNGCVTDDLREIIERHQKCIKYKSHKFSDAEGKVQVPFGQMTQDNEALEENFKYLVTTLNALKHKNLEPLINSIHVIAPPSTEVFPLKLDGYVQTTESKSKAADEFESDSDEE